MNELMKSVFTLTPLVVDAAGIDPVRGNEEEICNSSLISRIPLETLCTI